MKRILAVVALLAPLAITGSASAMTPSEVTTPCTSSTSMFCSDNGLSRPEGPSIVNYVDDTSDGQQFCQLQNYFRPVLTCHDYWPFVNPTVNADRAPAAAFNGKRLVATQDTVDAMRAQVTHQAGKIARLKARIARLRQR